jgi:hypothetical protein
MNPIQPLLRQGDQGPKVTNLQEALLFLLSKAPTRFGFPDAGSAAALAPKIEAEKAGSVFKDETNGAVLRLQDVNQLEQVQASWMMPRRRRSNYTPPSRNCRAGHRHNFIQ